MKAAAALNIVLWLANIALAATYAHSWAHGILSGVGMAVAMMQWRIAGEG
jgi:hypothetical protein